MGKKRGAACAGEIEMVFLPPIEIRNLTEQDLPDLLKQVRGAIAAELRGEI